MTVKRYNVSWNWTNILGDSQSEVVRLQNIIKGLYATCSFSTFLGSNSTNAMVVAGIGFVLDVLAGGFYFEKIEQTPINLNGQGHSNDVQQGGN